MSIKTLLDIETLPVTDQKTREAIFQDVKQNFSAPKSLTKNQAGIDLGLTTSEIKFIGKEDLLARWAETFADTKAEEVASELWLKTSFDGWIGSIVSIAWQTQGYEPQVVYREDYRVEGSEADMLTRFVAQLKPQLNGQQVFWIGHNCGSFDLPFLFKRLVINGVDPKFRVPISARQGNEMYDTMLGAVGYGNRISQKNLCEHLGFDGKPDEISGADVWPIIEKEGKAGAARIAKYNISDVDVVRLMYDRLTFGNFNNTFDGVKFE